MHDIIHLIRNEDELDAAHAEIGRLLDIDERTEDQDDRLELLSVLVCAYEDQHWPLEKPDPIGAIQARMDDLGLQQIDLLDEFGNKTTASQVLNRKRALTLPVIRRLSARLGLSMALLTKEYSLAPDAVAEPPKRTWRVSAHQPRNRKVARRA
ncbi:MAG: transcriptional regulator [Acetobacteraceae bacterium]|jgi:HTH-type transcriptional regulator/antitoxin HigA